MPLGIAGATLIGAGLQTGTGILNMIGQRKREDRQYERTQDLMDIQQKNQQQLIGDQYGYNSQLMEQSMQNQQLLNKQGADLQYEMWKKTNYPAQMEMLKQAGLNPSLIYGMKGGGGTTTGSQGGGSAPSASVGSGSSAMGSPAMHPMDIGNIVAGAKTMAETALLKAQKNKIESETDKTDAETDEVRTRIEKLIVETENEKVKTELNQVLVAIQKIEEKARGIDLQYQVSRIEGELYKLYAEIDSTELNNKWKRETWDLAKQDLCADILLKHYQKLAIESNIEVNDVQMKKMVNDMLIAWEQIGINKRQLDQKDMEIIISRFQAIVQANNPGLWNIVGRGTRDMANFINDLLNFRRPRSYYDTPEGNTYENNIDRSDSDELVPPTPPYRGRR